MNEFETGLEWLSRAVATLVSWTAAGTLALALAGVAVVLLAQWVGTVARRGVAGAPWVGGHRQEPRALAPQCAQFTLRDPAAGRTVSETVPSPRRGRCAAGQVCAA